MAGKDFKTLDEQLQILRSCGLTITDDATQKYPFVRMDYYGFRNDWKQKL
jgi:hypothetical protein